MELREMDPYDLKVDPLNERKQGTGPHSPDNHDLEENIRKVGVVQPIIVRELDDQYNVVVGQRRTLAAQGAGVDSVPVIVMEWDDAEALQASITENIDAFRSEVAPADRGAAIKKLMEMNDWGVKETSEELGVPQTTVERWLEPVRSEWEETIKKVEEKGESPEEAKRTLEEAGPSNLQEIRTGAESSEDREEVLEKTVEENITRDQLREAKKIKSRSDKTLTEAVEEVQEETKEIEGTIKANIRMQLTGDYAKGLKDAAKDLGTSEERVVKKAVEEYLNDEGYL